MKKQKLKLLVTGSKGQLGECLREIAPKTKHKFIFTDIEELDITSSAAVAEVLERERPDFVINCAAYTAVDKAEGEEELAKKINAKAVEVLSIQSAKSGAGIVHISTDYVFKGDDPTPQKEDNPTEPQSVYGRTKLLGEKAAQKNPRHIILRTSWLYSTYGNNFVKTMRRLGEKKRELGVVGDQWGSPTSAHDLAKGIITAIEKPVWGTFHFSNQGTASWAIFAQEIMNLSGLNCTINHITTEEYPTPALRPKYSLLNKDKFSKTFGVEILEWEHSLEYVIERLEKEK